MPRPGTALLMAKRASAAAFDPRTQVTALHVCWADDPDWSNPGNGNPVISWRNHSGGGDPTQGTGSRRPTFRSSTAAYNNHATVEFVRANSTYLAVNIADVAQAFKMLVVANLGSAAGNEKAVGGGDSSGTTRGLGDTVGDAWELHFGSSLAGGTSDSTPRVFRATVNGASSQLWVNGSSVASGNAGANAEINFSVGAGFSNTSTFGNHLNGHVAFAALYSGATSDVTLAALAADLKTYYGL